MSGERPADERRELRKLPQVARVLDALTSTEPHSVVAHAVNQEMEIFRASIERGTPAPSPEEIIAAVEERLEARRRSRLGGVVNATGVLLHTNLGRAPLSDMALEAISAIGSGYSNLEFNLGAGKRGSRYEHARQLLIDLTGAESALVVNNNAAAVLLCLAASARGKEVIISRGELIEIGGEFRIPDILAESGATLVEVGTTNRTRIRDYERAIGERTSAIMKVHPSNYRVVGFTASVDPDELVDVAHAHGLLLIHDIGSGLIKRNVGGFEPEWLRDEPTVVEAVASGADLITFSGDKLLGGPQAGIILGSRHAVERIASSPLLRAVRVDKVTLGALESTLLAYLHGNEIQLPLWQMALASVDEIESRARAILSATGDLKAKLELVEGSSTTGGGSSPQSSIPTVIIEIAPRSSDPEAVIAALLDHDPPVVARIREDRVVLDLRTVFPAQDQVVLHALIEIL